MMKETTPQETRQLLNDGNGVIYLDVRSVPEFEQGHVPGARNIPLLHADVNGQMTPNQDFPRVVVANLSKDATIIVGCKAGPRSEQAVQIMEQLGYTDVANMLGGMCGKTSFTGDVIEPGWIGRGYPVSTTTAPGSSYTDLSMHSP